MTSKRPAFATRLSSYLLDSALTYFLSFLLSPGADLLFKLGNHLLLTYDFVLFEMSLSRFVGLIILTQVVRFYSVLFFGHTIFAPLFGLTPKEGFIWSRIGGGFRQILELLLFPWVLTELIVNRHKSTLSERWTKTELLQVNAGVLSWLGHFLTPILILLSFYSPLFMNLTLFDGVVVIEEEIKAAPFAAAEDFDKFKLYRSERFKFESLSHLANDRFVLLPDYDFRRTSGQLRVVPFVKVLDQAQKRVGQFKVGPDIRWTPIILRSKEGLPFWGSSYKSLSRELSLLPEDAITGNVSQNLSPEACRDLQKLLKSSFELGGKNLLDHTLEFGPFIRGLVQLRTVLLEIVDPTSAPQVDLITLGQTPFLRFRQQLEFAEENYSSKHTLFPLCVTRSPYYELNFKNDMASSIARRDFTEVFLSKAKWDFVQLGAEAIPKRRADFHLFHLIDGLMNAQLDEEQRLSLEEGASYYLFNLGHRSFEDESLMQELLTSISRIQELVSLMEKRDETVFTKSFLFYLEKLQIALKQRNAAFFAAEPKEFK